MFFLFRERECLNGCLFLVLFNYEFGKQKSIYNLKSPINTDILLTNLLVKLWK